MIASLGMYDRPETKAANTAFWQNIRAELGYGPHQLDRETGFLDVWLNPDLVFSQTCGMPFRTILKDQVQLVGTPDYGLSGTKPGYYYSVFVVRAGETGDVSDFAGRRFAYNEAGSQSGWAAPQNHAQENGFQFTNAIKSGGHMNSAAAVANGVADIASLDAVTWRLACQFGDFEDKLQVLGTTKPTPGLPFITSIKRDSREVYDAVDAAIQNLNATDRETLGIKGIVRIEAPEYLKVPNPASP